MKEKFTEGPWVSDIRVGCCAVYQENSRDEWEHGLHQDERNIFYASYKNMALDPSYSRQAEEAIANANLIACAPDMYEMLESIIECANDSQNEISHSDLIYSLHDDINKLLKRARGE
jgi:hypothetical protein